ncbi:MAG: cache domain-containing protein [Gemmatimonadota bacterium]|jgi:hypothetical protein
MNVATRNQLSLIVLVILAFLPSVLLYRYASNTLRQHRLQQHEAELLQIARVTGVEYQMLVEESRQILGALAEFPEIRDGEGRACDRRLASVLRHTPQYTTLSVIGLDGYLACGSLTVDGGLYLGDRAYYRLATTNQTFSVGDYALGRITGKPTVGVAYPIMDADGANTERVLAASINLSALGARARDRALPEGTTFTVLDRSSNVLVRIPEGKHPLGYDTVGAAAPETFLAAPMEYREPFIEVGTDLDGVDRMFAVAPLRGGGARVAGFLAVGREQALLLAEVEEVVRAEFQFLALAALGVLILAWIFGHYALVRAPSSRSEA